MERLYYACWYRLDNADAYLLWYTDHWDGVILNEARQVLTFTDTDMVEQWARVHSLKVYTAELILHNLDVVQEWVRQPRKDKVDCMEFLNAWNLFIDIQTTLEQRDVLGEDRINNDLYDKIFFGNNLPAMTPPGEHYLPTWNDDEINRLQDVLAGGLRLFREVTIPFISE